MRHHQVLSPSGSEKSFSHRPDVPALTETMVSTIGRLVIGTWTLVQTYAVFSECQFGIQSEDDDSSLKS